MDRPIVYPDEGAADTDLLRGWKAAMVAHGWLIQAVLGTNTWVAGCGCTPGTGLTVSVAPGAIFAQEQTDATAYGTLGTDTTLLMKEGLLLAASVLSCPAPGTSGQSINYLIEAQYQDVDGGSLVLPYYNSANPALPYSGPGNTGTSQPTLRQGVLALQVKAGTAATTGSQTTPAPDSGWVGLWVVTVANGAVSISTGNISQYPYAPFIGPALPQKEIFTYDQSGAGNSPNLTQLPFNTPWDGMKVTWVQKTTSAGGTFSLSIGSGASQPLKWQGATPPSGALVANHPYTAVWLNGLGYWALMTYPG